MQVCLALAREISPAPEEGERVIFYSHCMRGIGLPAGVPAPGSVEDARVTDVSSSAVQGPDPSEETMA